MGNKRYQDCFDEEVLAASPLKLTQLLYRGALVSIASARRYLKLGDIRARSRAISKAMSIITELSLSLNKKDGGELSQKLADLYGYLEMLLMSANSEQRDPPLAEAEHLLGTLAAAWESIEQTPAPPVTGGPRAVKPHEPIRMAY